MKILEFPDLRQTYEYDCGANAVQSVLIYYGIDLSESTIMKVTGTRKTGTPVKGIKKILRNHGLKYKAGKMTIAEVKREIDKNRPVILLLQAWTKKKKVNWKNEWNNGHYAVAIGHDLKSILFEDPSTALRTYLTYEEFKERWHDIDLNRKRYVNYGISVYGKKHTFTLKKTIHMD